MTPLNNSSFFLFDKRQREVKQTEVYTYQTQNAEIPASGTEDFFASNGNRQKYGSSNKLLLVNRSGKNIKLFLDGNVYAELFTNAGITINPEDGVYFDLLRVENLDTGAVCSASTITVRIARVEEV